MTGTGSGWRSPAAALVGVLLVFFAVPDRIAWSDSSFVLSVVGLVTGTVVLAWAIVGQVRRQLTGDADGLQTLVTLLALVLAVFAFGFYALERASPGEVVGLSTRVDSLYFTLATMATVGYGDVHAEGQVARAIVASQMIFNIVFVGALASVLAGRVRIRAHERSLARRGSSAHGEVPALRSVPPSAWASGLASGDGAVAGVRSVPVDETTRDLLTGLTMGDFTAWGTPGEVEDSPGRRELDRRSLALVRIASLVALDAPSASYRSELAAAADAGVTAEDALGVLRAVAPHVGAPKVATAATHVMAALGLDAPEPSKDTPAGDPHRAAPFPRSPA